MCKVGSQSQTVKDNFHTLSLSGVRRPHHQCVRVCVCDACVCVCVCVHVCMCMSEALAGESLGDRDREGERNPESTLQLVTNIITFSQLVTTSLHSQWPRAAVSSVKVVVVAVVWGGERCGLKGRWPGLLKNLEMRTQGASVYSGCATGAPGPPWCLEVQSSLPGSYTGGRVLVRVCWTEWPHH